jgi:hypothetical protein
VSDVLGNAEDIVNEVAPSALAEFRETEAAKEKETRRRRWWRKG